MMKHIARAILAAAVASATWLALAPSAEAVPSYSRRYGLECSSCHTMWGALNAAGVTFRLSGYRAMFGTDLVPITPDIEVGGGVFAIPTTLPISFITGFGGDWRTEKRQPSDGTVFRRTASSLDIEDASIFLTGPIGKRFSAFVEFPMFETKAWEFTPTGPAEANDHTQIRQFQFASETPVFEVAKFWWNNLLGDVLLPRDSFNALIGITHLPLPYSPGKVRLSVNQYPVYERRALDLISPTSSTGTFTGVGPWLPNDMPDKLFRLSEPQALAEFNGMIVPGGNPGDTSKRETFWLEYHLGISNGTSTLADNNNAKDVYGRLVGRYYGQSLGVFGLFDPDTYDDTTRRAGALPGACGDKPLESPLSVPACLGLANSTNPLFNPGSQLFNTGIFNPLQPYAKNDLAKFGVDGTLSLVPWKIPFSLDNQFMWSREGNPTLFGVPFTWIGGFHQLNWWISKEAVAYGRFDWIQGKEFNDVPSGGITDVKPREWDVVAGAQYLLYQNVKLVAEFRHHVFEDQIPKPPDQHTAKLIDDGGTLRVMMGF
jgi:hypothetical protein